MRSTSWPARWCAARHVAARDGIGVVTSRVSVEMMQKAAAIGIPVLVAVSAPTALAVRTAEAAGMTLVAVARQRRLRDLHPSRIASRKSGALHVVAG